MPNAEEVLALEPEELGLVLVGILHNTYGINKFHIHNLSIEFDVMLPGEGYYPQNFHRRLKSAFLEAAAWLMNNELIVMSAEDANWKVLSRKALRAAEAGLLPQLRAAIEFPKSLIHERIRERVWPMYIRGEYSAAVFTAMREVEIAVRLAGGYGERSIGTDLIRQAFRPEGGPLTDDEAPLAEREGIMNLFVGAIGSYKNPHSHRDVNLNQPQEAAELLILASLLLRIVDARQSLRTGG